MPRKPETFFEIVVTHPDRGFRWEAEADSPDNAFAAAQQGFDECMAYVGKWGASKNVTTTVLMNGMHVSTIHGRRPV